MNNACTRFSNFLTESILNVEIFFELFYLKKYFFAQNLPQILLGQEQALLRLPDGKLLVGGAMHKLWD